MENFQFLPARERAEIRALRQGDKEICGMEEKILCRTYYTTCRIQKKFSQKIYVFRVCVFELYRAFGALSSEMNWGLFLAHCGALAGSEEI